MNEIKKQHFLTICTNLMDEADEVSETKFQDQKTIMSPIYVDTYHLSRWWGKVKSFIHLLGPLAKPWYKDFEANPKLNTLFFTQHIKGTLEAIYSEIENDHFLTMYQMLRAETLIDLFEQAELLLNNGYYLASGVIGRAILEEHLRTICKELDFYPDKEKPTLNDFNLALYKNDFYSKTKMKHIDTLISIGNNAAHNNEELTIADIKKLIQDLPELIDSTNIS